MRTVGHPYSLTPVTFGGSLVAAAQAEGLRATESISL